MFYDKSQNIGDTIKDTSFSIVETNDPDSVIKIFKNQPNKLIEPNSNNIITVNEIKEIVGICALRQKNDFYVLVNSADKMNEQAQNAFLKLLEEPKDNYHFVLVTSCHTVLLPTIRSRANIYIERITNTTTAPINADDKIKSYAKLIISSKNTDLLNIYSKISLEKEYKNNPRLFVCSITETEIEILYKSFFCTKKPIFLKKLPKLIKLYQNLKQNGNIKLHFIADLC